MKTKGEKKIKWQRHELDKVDYDLIRLLGKRFKICMEIGRIKAINGMPIHLPQRENDMLVNRVTIAKQHSVAGNFIRQLFQIIIAESKRLQEFLK